MKKHSSIVDIGPIKERKVYSEFYFGIGFGITAIDTVMVIILPFVMIMVTDKE